MKSLEEKRNELAENGEYAEGVSCSFYMNEIKSFKDGWDACAKEYEKELQFWKSFDMKSISDENAELKRQLEIAEKDSQRLEWLIDNNYVVSCGINTFWVSEVDGQSRIGPKTLTSRDAIDECRKFHP